MEIPRFVVSKISFGLSVLCFNLRNTETLKYVNLNNSWKNFESDKVKKNLIKLFLNLNLN